MDYYELRKMVAKIIPRTTFLINEKKKYVAQTEVPIKGRKTSYKEFVLTKKEWQNKTKYLNSREIGAFIEISCRAEACPMPLNVDVWDGLVCPYRCIYCFATAFKTYLYTAFFDNAKTVGMRHCNPNKFKYELDKVMKLRGKDPHSIESDIAKAIAMEMPLRFGIRFEDFTRKEGREGISLELLNYLADLEYPVMINTKSNLIANERYIKALSRNKGKAAVHITLISSDNKILKALEPGAPSYKQRLDTMKVLSENGIRVVARIEPFIVFITDEKDTVNKYIEDVWNAGVRHITLDTYSYTAKNPGIYNCFKNEGIDWDRISLVGCDSQALGSLLLNKFIDLFKIKGFSCSTFDMGNVPDNNQSVCCEVEDWFKKGFNYGCSVMAARYIQEQDGKSVSWSTFVEWVNKHGGFLSKIIQLKTHQLWNCEGMDAYSHVWARGMIPVGNDENGLIWKFNPKQDFRIDEYEIIKNSLDV